MCRVPFREEYAPLASTANKGLSVQALNANIGTWGAGASDGLNTGVISPIDTMLGGITSLSLASTTPQLLSTSQCQNALLRLTGVLLANIVISPDSGVLLTGFVYFENLTTGSFSVTFTNSAGSVVLPQARRGVMWVDTTNGPRVMSSVGSSQTDVIPAGSAMLFYNSAAPTGWSAVAASDYAIRVSTTGGVSFGSLSYSTWWNRTATDSHVLTTNEIPSHTHTYTAPSAIGTLTSSSPDATRYTTTTGTSGATGGGNGHTHGFDMRVATLDFVLASRN